MPGQFHAVGDAGRERHGRSAQTERSHSRWCWHSFRVGAPAAATRLAATLPSHALIHTAEGEFFLEGLVRASEHCSLHVTKVNEREVWDRGTMVFRLPPQICSNGSANSEYRSGHPGDRRKAGVAGSMDRANRIEAARPHARSSGSLTERAEHLVSLCQPLTKSANYRYRLITPE